MLLIKTENYSEAVVQYMNLAVQANSTLTAVPRLKNPLIGSYEVGLDVSEPYFKYHLKLTKSSLTLDEVKALETSLQTKLVG